LRHGEEDSVISTAPGTAEICSRACSVLALLMMS